MAPTLQKLAVIGVVFSVSMMGMDGCGPMDGEWKELTMKDNSTCGINFTDSTGFAFDEVREHDKTWEECKNLCLDAVSKDDIKECIAASVVNVKEVTRPAGKDAAGKDTPEEKVQAGECTYYAAKHSEHEISDKKWFEEGGKEMENEQHCAKHLGGFAKYAKAVDAIKAEKKKTEDEAAKEAEKKKKEAEAEAAKNGGTGGNGGQSFAATGQQSHLRTNQGTSQAMVVHHHHQVGDVLHE